MISDEVLEVLQVLYGSGGGGKEVAVEAKGRCQTFKELVGMMVE